MTIALAGKNKLCLVDGSLSKPSTTSSDSKPWERVNNVVIGWILVVLESSIARSVLWYKTTREIWVELEERCGQSSAAQLFAIQEEINNISQSSEGSVPEFYTKIKSLWDELDNLDPLPTCSCNNCACNVTTKLYKMQQKQRLIHFLMKLESKYSQVRSNILMMAELPTIAQAYRILMQEQKHQEISNTDEGRNNSLAFGANKRLHRNTIPYSGDFTNRGGHSSHGSRLTPSSNVTPINKVNAGFKRPNNYYCDHCKVYSHSMERCWKIHGYPDNFKPNSWKRGIHSKANAATTDADDIDSEMRTTNLTSQQYKKLMNMMQQQETSDNDNNLANANDGAALLAGNICLIAHQHNT
ncbi:unnamed protein product [Amaranthus hypochondriacus]